MGLDLIVEGCAKPGHETEWRAVMERTCGGAELTEEEIRRFQEISIPAYANVGAPRVGYDAAADAWIIEVRKATTPDEIDAVLETFHGHYALPLVECDGLPKYTHSIIFDHVDETSFRGAFLPECDRVLTPALIAEAWETKFPERAVDYGEALLAAAERATAGDGPTPSPRKQSLLSRLLGRKPSEPMPRDEQLEIVRAAGRWYLFWGKRGHVIRPWF